jgi:hypothetical protein
MAAVGVVLVQYSHVMQMGLTSKSPLQKHLRRSFCQENNLYGEKWGHFKGLFVGEITENAKRSFGWFISKGRAKVQLISATKQALKAFNIPPVSG